MCYNFGIPAEVLPMNYKGRPRGTAACKPKNLGSLDLTIHGQKPSHGCCAVQKHKAGNAGASACAFHGLSISPAQEGSAWKARLGILGQAQSDFRAWVFLASARKLQAFPDAEVEFGLLDAKAERQSSARC